MHTLYTLRALNFGFRGAKQLVGWVLSKNKTALTPSTYQLLAETQGAPGASHPPLYLFCVCDTRVQIARSETCIRLQSGEVTTCL